MDNQTVGSTLREITSQIKFSYLKNSVWNVFSGKLSGSLDGIRMETSSSSFYLQYRTKNQGKTGFYPYVTSKQNDYAGSSGKPIQLLEIRAYNGSGTKLNSGIVVMYRVYADGRWLPWVSNADPEWMRIVQSKYSLGGTLETTAYYAGLDGKNVEGVEIRVFEEDYSASTDFTGGEITPSLRYLKGSTWTSFNKSTISPTMDGLEIRTSTSKDYYLSYQTHNEGQSGYYPAVSSIGGDYAGSANKPIQRLNIKVFKKDGTKLTAGVVVMYRARIDGEWLPWVSNADPEWMRNVQSKYSLGGTLDTSGAYAGIYGRNMEGIEIRIFEDGSLNAGSGDFVGSEIALSSSYMKDNASNWTSFSKTIMTGDYIDGVKFQTGANESFYLSYTTLNEGQASYYPVMKSNQDGYAGFPGKHMQRLSILIYDNNGVKLRSGVVLMYRAYVDDRWLPWVSNADPEWMRSVQTQYNLGGTLDYTSSYAGIDGKNIKGIEVRLFKGQTSSSSVGDLTDKEETPSLKYLVNTTWKSFDKSVTSTHVDGIEIRTSADKPYYLSYQTLNEGRSYYYPVVTSLQNDYAGYPNKPIQLLSIKAYTKAGTKITTGVVVMYRVRLNGRWQPWVSNADPAWMRSVQRKYGLDGTLDESGYYAGVQGQNIQGVEIRIFEEKEITYAPQTPTGAHKIIEAPFITQVGKYPTGCESVTAVMALYYNGMNISVDDFIDRYLYKTSTPFDPNVSFGGNPRSTSGYGCYAPVIKNALDKALKGESIEAKVLSHVPLETLCSQYIDNDIPVIMWATMNMSTPYISSSWYYNGKNIRWVAPEHCLLLVGYDEEYYIFNDPLQMHGQIYYNKAAVEIAYAGLQEQAIVILEKDLMEQVRKLEKVDRETLMSTYHYSSYYNKLHEGDIAVTDIPSNFNDYNILACIQLLYLYFWDQEDYEKTDMLYDEMIKLRKMNPSYRSIYSEFIDSSGEFNLGYQYYAPGRKTTKIYFENATYFDKEQIRKMHQADDWMVFMAALIPGVGGFLSFLLASMKNIEQGEVFGIAEDIVQGYADYKGEKLLGDLLDSLKAPGYIGLALTTLANFCKTAYDTAGEDRETYVKDGVTLQDGDSYIQVRLYYDMGVEYHDFRFYFRNGYPYVTDLEQFVVRWDDDPRGIGVTNRKVEEYTKQGYVPSERHFPRGEYWPL